MSNMSKESKIEAQNEVVNILNEVMEKFKTLKSNFKNTDIVDFEEKNDCDKSIDYNINYFQEQVNIVKTDIENTKF